MNKSIEHAQDLFLERINNLCVKFGLNNIMAELYTVLYFSDKPLSLNDLVDRLRISKASVSINVRALERYGVARKVWVKGSRRDYYEAEQDISKVVFDRVKSMVKTRLVEIDGTISSARTYIRAVHPKEKNDSGDIESFKRKLDKLEDLHKKVRGLFDVFNSGMFDSMFNVRSDETEKRELYAAPLKGEL